MCLKTLLRKPSIERGQTRGARKSWCLMKNVELSQLIERLQNGQSVTVQEIEEGVDGLLGPQFGYASIAFDGCD
jgi:hypothetical protein